MMLFLLITTLISNVFCFVSSYTFSGNEGNQKHMYFKKLLIYCYIENLNMNTIMNKTGNSQSKTYS